MPIEFDPAKRRRVLQERGLDLALCDEVFARFHLTRRDEAHSDEEARFTTLGLIGETVVIVIWTPRESHRRIITMWKANDRERTKFQALCERHGRS